MNFPFESQSVKIFITALKLSSSVLHFCLFAFKFKLHITTISLPCVSSTNKSVSIQKDEHAVSGQTESTNILEVELLNFEQHIPLHFSLQPVSWNVSMPLNENYVWKREVGLSLHFVSNFSFIGKCECNSSIKRRKILWCFVFG